MAFHLHALLATLCLLLVACQAALPSEVYWKFVLPDTPMPRAISNVLRPGTGQTIERSWCGIYNRRGYAAKIGGEELIVNPPKALYFLEKDMYPGKEFMKMEITRPENDATTFLPRRVSDSIPFTSEKFPTILKKLSIKPNSDQARLMKYTLKECEEPAARDEVKTCATSLESMIDFTVSKFGKSVQAFSTEVQKDAPLQKYTIVKGIRKITSDEAVACHRANYPYAVFYCHSFKGTRAYVVPLVGADGTKAKAVAVCHLDTSSWDEHQLAFTLLKVERGTVPVCHFLPEDEVVWTRK